MTSTTRLTRPTFLLAALALLSVSLLAPPAMATPETAPGQKTAAQLEASFSDLFPHASPQASLSTRSTDWNRCRGRCEQRISNCSDRCVDSPFGTGTLCILVCEIDYTGCIATCDILY